MEDDEIQYQDYIELLAAQKEHYRELQAEHYRELEAAMSEATKHQQPAPLKGSTY